MAITIPFRLQKPASIFQTQDSTGFNIRCGVKVKDPKTKADSWTNYSATVFAKSIPQIEYYTKMLVEGSLAVVSGQSIFVDVYQGNNGQSITLSLIGANIETIVNAVQAPANARPQGDYARNAPQLTNTHNEPQKPAPHGFDSFDDEIPFS